jgi:predicted RecB family endonuclease
MTHQIDRCDFIDMLEESAVTGLAVSVRLKNGDHFVDEVRDVTTSDGTDWAIFRQHGQIAVNDIRDCVRAEPLKHGPAHAV